MKNFKGGYKIVSLELKDITSGFTLKGLYNALKDSYSKPILVSEIVMDGTKKNDAYTIVSKSGTSYVIEVYGQILTVATNDAVTVATKPEITSIGTGLSLTNGELSISAEGNGLYLHSITVNYRSGNTDYLIVFNLYMSDGNKSNSFSALIDKIYENYVISEEIEIMCGGYVQGGMAYALILPATKPESSTNLRLYIINSLTQTTFEYKTFALSQVNAYIETVCKVV